MPLNNPNPQAVLSQLQKCSQECGDLPRVDPAVVCRLGAFVGSVVESHIFLPRAMDHGRNRILSQAEQGKSIASGTVILADTMSGCKGRFGRSWHAPPGGVWGCMILAITLLPQSRSFIPLAAGVACCEAIRHFGGTSCSLRWVNDVLIAGRKIGGFLVESYTEPFYGEEFALVGFGININNSMFPDDLQKTAVSLCQILGKTVDLTEFTTFFLARLAWHVGVINYEEARSLREENFSGEKGRHLLLESWLELSDTIGKRVCYGFDVMTAPQYQAEVLGIDEIGGLILRLDDGMTKVEYSGEVRYIA